MKVSLNTIRQYTSVDVSVDELVQKINRQLGGVEKVIDLGSHYDGAVIVKIEKCEKHPNADKLNVCQIDDGTGELTQVVCGAPNVREGMFAVWLRPGSTVPSTIDDKEPFVLGARELRGETSNGMLASPKELGLGDSHEGILEIDPSEWKPNDIQVKPGVPFAEVYGLNDHIIDIENKMFTHRPDLFGQLGVAREIAGIQHNAFKSPQWYGHAQPASGDGLSLSVENQALESVPRFTAMVMKDVVVKPSPVWLQCALIAMGGKPINNVVDVTNYIMLLTAQPTHAYDYDKLRGHTIGARMAKKGEKITLLNHKTYELDEADIVIVDGEGPVGLGGIMGGGESEVSIDTKNLVLEVANFDMYTVRRSSMRHGIFTDALTRFNKGQSVLQNATILSLLQSSIQDVAGGAPATKVFDIHGELRREHKGVISIDFINERLGLALTKSEIETLLRNVEFTIHDNPSDVEYSVPFWRTDIALPEDIVEEVGRLYGYENLPRELPLRSIAPAAHTPELENKRRIRTRLARNGANEVLTYSFVHENILTRAQQDERYAFKLSNALSPDLQYFRLSLTPSLLDKVHMNLKAGHDRFGLFELNKLHFKGEMDAAEPTVPNEDSHVAFVLAYADKIAPEGAAYFHALTYLKQIMDLTGIEHIPLKSFDLSSDEWGAQLAAPYEPNRSVVIVRDGQVWGVVGEFKKSVMKAFKLPQFSAGFEIHLDIARESSAPYRPLSRYPSVTQDVSIRAKQEVQYAQVQQSVQAAIDVATDGYDIDLEPIMIYAPEDGVDRTTTIRLRVTSHRSTLTDKHVRPIIDAIGFRVKDDFDGSIV